MDYYFRGYQFKSEQLVLLKREQTVSLRANEAKLLTLLLSDPDRVFSKDAILENVWAGKNVAEQSIFQNISHLRAIFGDDAILTHPKKGYQWKIPLEDTPKQTKESPKRNINKQTIAVVVFVLSFLVITASWFFMSVEPGNHVTSITLAPLSIKEEDKLNDFTPAKVLFEKLNNSSSLLVTLAQSGKNFRELKASPDLLIENELTQNNSNLLLSTELRTHNSTIFIAFRLLAKKNILKGVVSASSFDNAVNELVRHVEHIVVSKILDTNKENLKLSLAQLQLLHNKFPTDMIILQHLIESLKKVGILNEALILAEQLKEHAAKQKNASYQGNANLLIGEILIHQGYFTRAGENLALAAEQFSAINDIEGIGNVAILNAILALIEGNYPALKNTLLSSINLFRDENAYFDEFDHTLTLAIYANKLGQIEDRDYYLAEAKRIQDSHDFPVESHSQIYFQQALFAEESGDESEAERYYRWMLDSFSPEQELWHKERAQYHLSMLLIRSERFAEAVDIFKNEEPLSNKEKVILAGIYKSWKKPAESIEYAKQAYRKSVLAGEMEASLNAALFLIELSDFDESLQADPFIRFLKKDSTPYWVKSNKRRLDELGLSILFELTKKPE